MKDLPIRTAHTNRKGELETVRLSKRGISTLAVQILKLKPSAVRRVPDLLVCREF
jgi:hypothetical protein